MDRLCQRRPSKWRKRFIVQQQQSIDSDSSDHYLTANYQFLSPSPLPTFYFQASLPRLPIPPLKSTCAQYLATVESILTPGQFLKTKEIVDRFERQGGIGSKLHAELVKIDKQASGTSYISAPWMQMYLSQRRSLTINSNPTLVFNQQESILEIQDLNRRQLVLATNLVVSSLRFMRSLEAQTLSPDVHHLNPGETDTPKYYNRMKRVPKAWATKMSIGSFKAYPLDMSQYNSLFRSTRIPQVGGDKIYKGQSTGRNAAIDIVVMRNGYFYSVPVLDSIGNILPVDKIMGSLAYIQQQEENEPCPDPVGMMTSLDRDKWAMARDHLVKSTHLNKLRVDAIDSALFILCLDEQTLGDEPNEVIPHFLHSDGANRWFDKSFQLIVTKDGWAGVTFEHAWGDGVPINRFLNEIFKDSTKYEWAHSIIPEPTIHPPYKLAFEMHDEIKEAIQEARAQLNAQISILKINTLNFEKYGKRQCKEWGVSPDSIAQLCFQIAFYRMYNHTPPTYESCSTCVFKHGRTETIRPSTSFTLETCRAMARENWPSRKYELKELINKCSQKHRELSKEAARGHGFDRHLFALKCLAKGRKEKLPELFTDVAYTRINHNILSTSTLSSSVLKFGGFGPTVIDGFGISYQMWEEGVGLVVSSYEGQRDGLDFVNQCSQVFLDIHAIMSIEIAKW